MSELILAGSKGIYKNIPPSTRVIFGSDVFTVVKDVLPDSEIIDVKFEDGLIACWLYMRDVEITSKVIANPENSLN